METSLGCEASKSQAMLNYRVRLPQKRNGGGAGGVRERPQGVKALATKPDIIEGKNQLENTILGLTHMCWGYHTQINKIGQPSFKKLKDDN